MAKKQHKLKFTPDILPCHFKDPEEYTCKNSESEMYYYIPSNTYCEKCSLRFVLEVEKK